MKRVIPCTGFFFVAVLSLLPAGTLFVAFATVHGQKQPSGWKAWLVALLRRRQHALVPYYFPIEHKHHEFTTTA